MRRTKTLSSRLARLSGLVVGVAISSCSFLAPSDRELTGGGSSKVLPNDASVVEVGPPSKPNPEPAPGAGGAPAQMPTGMSPVQPDAGCTGCGSVSPAPSPEAGVRDAGAPEAGEADSGPEPSPAAALAGLRLDVHCGAQDGTSDSCREVLPTGVSCPSEGYQMSRAVVFGGSPTLQYWVKLRFRGIVRRSTRAGSRTSRGATGASTRGGAPGGNAVFNEYGFSVSSPGQSYFLNNWMEGDYVIALDYQESILVHGGSKVTLFSYSKLCAQEYDCADLSKAPSCEPKALSGVTHLKDKGQFVQIDVVSVAVAEAGAKPGIQVSAQ